MSVGKWIWGKGERRDLEPSLPRIALFCLGPLWRYVEPPRILPLEGGLISLGFTPCFDGVTDLMLTWGYPSVGGTRSNASTRGIRRVASARRRGTLSVYFQDQKSLVPGRQRG